MRRSIRTKQARPTISCQPSQASGTLDGLLARRRPAEVDHTPPAAESAAAGSAGHDFGHVAIYPPGQSDDAPHAVADRDASEQQVTHVAQSGFQGSAQEFPFREQIEASFGRPIPAQAHIDKHAADACDALGASAFTSAGRVAFAGSPTLHTAAHEAAHAVQQQEGVASFRGLDRSGDVLERHADHVAGAVTAGKAAAPILGKSTALGKGAATTGAGAAVQLKKKDENDTSFVGGEEGNALMGPGDTDYVGPGEGGYARRVQGATAQYAGEFKEVTDATRMKPVAPQLGQVERAVAIAIWDRDWYKKQTGRGDIASVKRIWNDRIDYADKKATQYTEDKRQEQANFRSYNSFVPLGNSLVQQIGRIEAQKYILGISDDSAMTTALGKGINDARKVGQAAQDAFDKNKDDEPVKAPSAVTSVEGAAQKARDAAADLDAAYLAFQQAVTLDQEAAAIKESGKESQKRLDEINEVKTFLKDVGKTVDLAQSMIKTAPEKIANYVNKPSSLIPGAEKAAELITDFIFYEEVQKLTRLLDTLNGMIEKKKLVKEFAHVSSVSKAYKSSLVKFAGAGVDMQRALHQRRDDYLEMGTRMDRFAQDDPTSRKAGLAPARGGDRYATMMALVAELRQAVALARFVKTGMPDLEGAPPVKDAKAPPWATWAAGVIEHRDSYASYHPNPTRFEMPYDEKQALEQAWSYLKMSDNICDETIKRFGPLDKQAGELMAALGGMKSI